MKLRRGMIVGLLVAISVAAMSVTANATPIVSDDNLLLGETVASSSFVTGQDPALAVDGKAAVTGGVNCDLIMNDPEPRLVVSGFNSPIDTIRIWGIGDVDPTAVTIKSSTSLLTPTTGSFASDLYTSFETSLVPYTTSLTWTSAGTSGDQPWAVHYLEYSVSAPAGTQSLYLAFSPSPNYGLGWTRISEVQAFGVPEPSTSVLVVAGVLGLLAYAWRKRK